MVEQSAVIYSISSLEMNKLRIVSEIVFIYILIAVGCSFRPFMRRLGHAKIKATQYYPKYRFSCINILRDSNPSAISKLWMTEPEVTTVEIQVRTILI